MASKYRFRVLRGSHRVGPKRDKNGNLIAAGRNAKTGEIVESSVDLCARFPSVPPKFQRIDVVEEQERGVLDTLRSLTKAELISKAEEQEINLDGCSTKEEILEAFVTQLA